MNGVVSVVLLIGGLVLLVLGVNSMNSFSSDVSRFFTGSPTDKAVWMFVGGLAAAVLGLIFSVRRSKRG